MKLDESFINLSVLIHLVCLVTEPNGFISSDNLFYIVCLFIHIWYVSIQYWMGSMFRWTIATLVAMVIFYFVCFYGNFIFIYLLLIIYYPGNNGFITLATKGLFITLVTKGFPSNKRFLLLGNNGFPLVTSFTSNLFLCFIHSDNWFLSIFA